MQVLDQQRVAKRQHHRGVGVGPDRQPLDITASIKIIGRRRHIDEAHTRVAHAEEAAFDIVHDGAAGVDLGVLARHAAEGHEKLCSGWRASPSSCGSPISPPTAPTMRHQYEGSTNAVVILVRHEAADRIEEAP